MKPVPKIEHIYAKVSAGKRLIDKRVGRMAYTFGTVGMLCKQYGIKVKSFRSYVRFSAPKSRLRLFAEKLHFAGVSFTSRDPASRR